MGKRSFGEPPPTAEEREAARQAAAAMRLAIADPTTMGQPSTMFLSLSRPRRGERLTTWANLPGLRRVNHEYTHECLPGWVYQRSEIVPELIPDLEALAEQGVRPTVSTTPPKAKERR